MTVGFDLDGTLVEKVPDEVYEKNDLLSLAKAKPIAKTVMLAKQLQIQHEIIIITGRHIKTETVTRATVNSLGLGELKIFYRTHDPYILEKAIEEKAAHIRSNSVSIFVGDRYDLDGNAAKLAGIRFIHV